MTGSLTRMKYQFVEYGSQQWQDARKLRYVLFFQPHGLSPAIMDDEQEVHGSHLVAVHNDRVVGYGRLTESTGGELSISQMVVAPAHQGEGTGGMLLQRLISRAKSAGATSVELKARVAAVGFYASAGFQQCGPVYPSQTTGILHVHMKLRINTVKLPGKEG